MSPATHTIHQGDSQAVMEILPPESVQLMVTSPPYFGLRDYRGAEGSLEGQWGREATPEAHVQRLAEWARPCRRVLRKDGVLIINYGDSYASSTGAGRGNGENLALAYSRPGHKRVGTTHDGHRVPAGLKPKDLMGMPWRIAMALQQGWFRCQDCGLELHGPRWPVWEGAKLCVPCLRTGLPGRDIAQTEPGWYWRAWWPWVKANGMPESVRDRPALSVEVMLMFSRSPRYYWDQEAVRVGYAPATVERADGSQVTTDNPDVRPGFKRTLSKMPDGWDTGKGGHGSHHRQGREKGQAREIESHGRIRKTGDWWRESVPLLRAQMEAWLAHTRAFEAGETPVLLDLDGLPLGQLHPTYAYPGSHFATYPPALVRPIIRAATSERGQCPACGAPWVREVEAARGGSKGRSWHDHSHDHDGNGKTATSAGYLPGVTTGWRPSCGCVAPGTGTPLEPVPQVVLDPFCGTGTTNVVAAEEGRSSIGIDLYGGNHDFGGHTANDRLRAAAGTGPALDVVQAEREGQLSLLGGATP